MVSETVLSVYASVFGPTEAISANGSVLEQSAMFPVQRSIRNPSSLFALSIQVRSTWLNATGLAVRLLGAAGGCGGAGVVASASLLGSESPTALNAKTR